MHIAVIDDEAIVRTRLQKALAKEGHAVHTYGSGEEFLDSLESTRYDLAFLDIMLPGINGIEILRQAKNHFPEMEVILITGHSSIDSAIQAVKLGAFPRCLQALQTGRDQKPRGQGPGAQEIDLRKS